MLTQKMKKSGVLACVYIYSLLLSKAVVLLSSSYMSLFDGSIRLQTGNVLELSSFT